ncbi:MAG: cell division protein FtsX, partial [Actinobacteria bacterium HGW-Actinobacteria-8]
MRATSLKTLRDLHRQRGQVIAVAVTIMLGVLLYVSSAGAFQNLSSSYHYTYDSMNFADLVGTGGDTAAVSAAALSAGATETTARVQFDPPLQIEGTKLVGRIIGLPTDSRPAVGDVRVIDGAYLEPASSHDGATSQVLVESHAAETFGLKVGDTVQVFGDGAWQTVTVQGIVRSAEYLWPARSRQDVLGDAHAFAVLFAPEATAEEWAGMSPDQALVLLPQGASDATIAGVSQAMRDAGAVDVTPWQEQASHATLNEDLTGFNEMSVAFPMLFLTAAGVSAYVLLSRRILQERPIIGTLMAAGARPRRILRHYLAQGLIVGLAGSIVGVILGLIATSAMTRGYAGAVGVPDVIVELRPLLIVNGLIFGPIVGMLGAFGPALRAAHTAPSEAMRSAAPTALPGPWSRFVARLTRLPATTRMALRDVGRSRRRTLATMLGTVLSLILVLATLGMTTSMIDAITVHFDKINKEDASVTVAGPD